MRRSLPKSRKNIACITRRCRRRTATTRWTTPPSCTSWTRTGSSSRRSASSGSLKRRLRSCGAISEAPVRLSAKLQPGRNRQNCSCRHREPRRREINRVDGQHIERRIEEREQQDARGGKHPHYDAEQIRRLQQGIAPPEEAGERP